MPFIEVRSFEDGITDGARELVETIEELERIRRDARTTALLVRARELLGHVETYFAAEHSR
jgi:hypothetical protein